MTPKVLTHILTEHAAGSRDGQTVTIADDTDVTVFATLGNETLTLSRVSSVLLEDDILILHTARRERYVLVYEDVRAVRVAQSEPKAGLLS